MNRLLAKACKSPERTQEELLNFEIVQQGQHWSTEAWPELASEELQWMPLCSTIFSSGCCELSC